MHTPATCTATTTTATTTATATATATHALRRPVINLTYFFRLSLTAHSLTTHDHRFNSQKFALIESYTHDHRS